MRRADPLSGCPDDHSYRDYLNGQVALRPEEQLHLQTCLQCQQALDHLTESEYLAPFKSAAGFGWRSLSFLGPAIRPEDIGSISEFAIEEVVDNGGMGTVLRGCDLNLGRTVALKILMDQNSRSAYSRFEAEVRAVAKLASRHIVPVYSIGRTSDNRPFMVMPFVPGDNLAKLVVSGPLMPRQAAEYVRQVALGLAVAHEAGLIHRDIKPSNVLIDSSDGLAKLIDFGLVREPTTAGLTTINVVCGTPEYMSIEQAQRPSEIDARSDIYSLGIMLYECMTGTTPFRGQPLEVLEQHRSVDPIPPSKLNRLIPRDLETICLKAMAKDSARRYASADQLGQDLTYYLNGSPIEARPFSPWEKGLSWCKRNRPMALTIALLFLTMAAGTLVSTGLWLRSRQHAAAAMQHARDLQLSRKRMRESVQKFQSRVFSDESLHWQMSHEFRSDMFREVIDYLNEFASMPGLSLEQTQGLCQSYLEVAQSAIHVGQYEQAAIAAGRSLELARLPGTSPTLDGLLRECNAAKTLYLASAVQDSASSESLDFAAQRCLAAAEEASRRHPNHIPVETTRLGAWLALWEAGFEPPGAPPLGDRVLQTRHELEQLLLRAKSHEELLDVRRALAHAQLLSIRWTAPAEQPTLTGLFDANNLSLRELLRTLQKPMLECNRLSGRYRYLLGRHQGENGDIRSAIESIRQSTNDYQKAVVMQPQNRRWRSELAEAYLHLATCHEAVQELPMAQEALSLRITHFAQILETDPKEPTARLNVVEALIRFGEVSARMEDYRGAYRGFYTAAQDCRVVMIDAELRQWGFQTRLWALIKSYEALERFDSTAEKARTDEHLSHWLSFLRNDADYGPAVADQAAHAIEHRTATSRPPLPEWFRDNSLSH